MSDAKDPANQFPRFHYRVAIRISRIGDYTLDRPVEMQASVAHMVEPRPEEVLRAAPGAAASIRGLLVMHVRMGLAHVEEWRAETVDLGDVTILGIEPLPDPNARDGEGGPT